MNKRPVTNELICASFNMIRWSMTCDKINLEQKTFVVLQKAANYHILCVSLRLYFALLLFLARAKSIPVEQ